MNRNYFDIKREYHHRAKVRFMETGSFAGAEHYTSRRHYEKYRDLAERLGVTLTDSTAFTLDKAVRAYSKDSALNGSTFPLRLFDGYYYALRIYHRKALPSGYSLAENVCLYKHLILYEVLKLAPVFEEDDHGGSVEIIQV